MISETPIVVVTRPRPDHLELIRRIEARGLQALHSPAFSLEALDATHCRKVFEDCGPFDRLVVTSPMAARVLIAHLDPEVFRGLDLLVPGKGTASVLARVGLRAFFPNRGGTSEDLLQMQLLREVQGVRIGICAASGGRALLGRELLRRGAQVRRLEIYRRIPVEPAPELLQALRLGAQLIVMLSSLNAFEQLTFRLNPDARAQWLGALFIVSSARLESACRAAGAADVRRAQGAGDDAMIAGLTAVPF